jgi:MarR family transcriptional regulator, lower aerobic nicotinate degradation pathway regulator
MRATTSSETSLAKVDNRPAFGARDAFLRTPGHLLRRCHQIAVAIFLDECQAFDLTPLQYVTLAALATHGPLDKATIGGVVALDRTTIAVVVKNIEQRGLVTTRPSEQDRRAKLIKITAKGLNLVSSVQTQVAKAQERTVAPLTPGERAELLRLLRKIAEENNLLSRAPHRAPRSADA